MPSSPTPVGAVERLNVVHTAFLISVTGVLILMGICIARYRHLKRFRALKRIPRARVPVKARDVPSYYADVIAAGLERSLSTKVAPLDKPDGQLGWGNPNSDFASVHFKTSIAKSYLVLEAAALRKSPALFREPQMTVRDYVAMLLDRCPDLQTAPCRAYLSAYEMARFGSDEVTLHDYLRFRADFVALIESLDAASLDTTASSLPSPLAVSVIQ